MNIYALVSDSSAITFNTRTKAVMADIVQENVKEKVSGQIYRKGPFSQRPSCTLPYNNLFHPRPSPVKQRHETQPSQANTGE